MFGTGELLVILLVILILFGGKKLPELARSIGIGIREFKKACNGLDDDIDEKPTTKRQSKKDEDPITIEVEAEPKDRR